MLPPDSQRWTFERKILRAIFGPTKENDERRIKYNNELYELYGEPDIVIYIKVGRLQWAGHLIMMEDERPTKTAFQSNPGGNRLRGRPRARWGYNVTEGTIGVRMWTAKAKSEGDWNRILRKARTLNELSHH